MSAEIPVVPSAALVGVDGLDEETGPPAPPGRESPLRLSAESVARIRSEIHRARGREVCFLGSVTADRVIEDVRAVARGNHAAVLAVAKDAPQGGIMIHNHPSGVLAPSEADMSVAARVWEDGLGTAITDNEASDLYVVVEPPKPRVRVPLDLDLLESIVAPGGALSRHHPVYEDRAGQREMIRLVAETFNEGGIALIEAGTGTGKSLAYLLPAAAWALNNEERTVISTNTINLQEQLVRKDLPLVSALTGDEVPWAMVKGRGNYISIRRARLAMETQRELFEDDRSAELKALIEWIGSTDDGSTADLTFLPTSEVWEEVRSDPDICLRSKCPHFQDCFYQKSRRRAASARLLVVNHHLLFTDIAVRRATGNWSQSAVLPAYKHLILDEAHNVEDAATSHLGVEVTRQGLFRTLSRLDRRGKGVLNSVADLLRNAQAQTALELRTRLEEKVLPSVEDVRARLMIFVDVLEPLVPRREGVVARLGDGEGSIPEPMANEEVHERVKGLLGSLQRLARELAELRRGLETNEELEEATQGRLLDIRSAERRLGAAEAGIRLVLEPGDQEEHFVRWLELKGKGKRQNLGLSAAPIDLGPILRESLFDKLETVVMTSATLATRQTFGFVRNRLGLEDHELAALERPPQLRERIVQSPFDFERQTILVVPTDLADMSSQPELFSEQTARAVSELATITDGGVFVLFTAHRALREVAVLLRDQGLDEKWPLFVHGEDDRARLLQGFIESGRGVLLGTASFWEGVDVPGDPLRGLILQKLPFRVPTEPVTAARVEALERRGGNAFYQYMLPLAALRLKQGFGRLVRTRDDHGAVVLMDDRIVKKRYGPYLRESLPPAPLVRGPWDEMAGRIRRFYAGGD